MTISNGVGVRVSGWGGDLLTSTSMIALSVGVMLAEPVFAQQSGSAALPPVTVTAPGAAPRVRQAPAPRTASTRATRARRAAQAQPAKQPPSVNSQDARTGQVGLHHQQHVQCDQNQHGASQCATVGHDSDEAIHQGPGLYLDWRGHPLRSGVIYHQGKSHRDDLIIRGQRSNADFYTNGIRDDVQYFRDFYNLQRLEVLKGPNAMIFGRGGGGGVVNRVLKEADGIDHSRGVVGGNSYPGARVTTDIGQAVNENWAFRLNAMYENTQATGISSAWIAGRSIRPRRSRPTIPRRSSSATNICTIAAP